MPYGPCKSLEQGLNLVVIVVALYFQMQRAMRGISKRPKEMRHQFRWHIPYPLSFKFSRKTTIGSSTKINISPGAGIIHGKTEPVSGQSLFIAKGHQKTISQR